jgi:hypothetical protein
MNGLMLHCGGQLKTKEEVFAVPPPPATESYVPLPYESFVTRIEKQLLAEDIKIKDERLALAKEGQRMFGLMALELPGFPTSDHGCVLGFRNSYDKSCSTGICLGATVFVCDNLSFSGSEVTFHRRHTTNLLRDLSWIITETVSKLPARFAAQSECFSKYKALELSDKAAHDLVIRLYDEHAINVSDIPGVLKEWRQPRHVDFVEAGKSGWRLFNAVTEIIKGDLWRLPAKTKALHNILDEECKVEPEFTVAE